MQDWDVEQERRTGARPQVRMPAVLVAVAALAFAAVGWGVAVRAHTRPSPWSVPASPAGEAPEQGDAPDDAAVEQAARILLGGGDEFGAVDPNARNLAAGQPVVLRNRDAEVQVTPGRVTLGTDTCAPGPLLTVAISVREVEGSATLPVHDFAMLTPAGPRRPIEACSIQHRSLVFAATEPGRLAYGPDPAAPEAVWRLT